MRKIRLKSLNFSFVTQFVRDKVYAISNMSQREKEIIISYIQFIEII